MLPPSMITSPGDKQRQQLLDQRVDRRAGLDHQHHLARRGQVLDQLFERVAADEVLALGAAR